MKVLILAGGFATRLWPLSEKKTKPLLPVGGKSIISHLVDKINPDLEIVISTNEQFEDQFQDWKEKNYPDRNINILVEPSKSEKDKKGAIGAIGYAVETYNIHDDLLVVAGDNLITFDINEFINKFDGNSLVAFYDKKDREAAKKFGVVEIKDNKVIDFEEKPSEPKSTIVSTLCYILQKEVLGDLKEFIKTGKDNAGDFIAFLVNNKSFIVRPFVFSGLWFDIGSFEAYLEANTQIQGSPIISEKALVSEDSKILGSSFIESEVVIENSIIEHSVIMEGCKIKNSTIRNCIIDDNCVMTNVTLENQMVRNKTKI